MHGGFARPIVQAGLYRGELHMLVAYRIAAVSDFTLNLAREVVPHFHGILPVSGTQLAQMATLFAIAYLYNEALDIWRSSRRPK